MISHNATNCVTCQKLLPRATKHDKCRGCRTQRCNKCGGGMPSGLRKRDNILLCLDCRGRRNPTLASVRRMKRRKAEELFKESNIKFTDVEYVAEGRRTQNTQKNTGMARITTGGTFEDPYLSFANAFNEALKNANTIKPIRDIDPKLVSRDLSLPAHKMKRFLAAKYARKYYNFGMMKIYAKWTRQGWPLNMYQCRVIITYARNIQNWIKEHGEELGWNTGQKVLVSSLKKTEPSL